jgi:DNA sulfur modification protein DndE
MRDLDVGTFGHGGQEQYSSATDEIGCDLSSTVFPLRLEAVLPKEYETLMRLEPKSVAPKWSMAPTSALIALGVAVAACGHDRPALPRRAPSEDRAVQTIVAAERTTSPSAKAEEEEAFRTGVDAYIYGYPLVSMEVTRRVMTNVKTPEGAHAPMGQFAHQKEYPSPSVKDITTPNTDTLYSTAWVDVSKEPYVLRVPDESGRYYLMPMLDAWTNVFASPGTRTMGTKAADFLITGPGFKGTVPKDMKELRSPTNLVWIGGRTYCDGSPADYDAARTIQTKYSLTPLSSFEKPYTPPPGKVDPNVDMSAPPREQVNRMTAHEYFALMATAMKKNPPAHNDQPMVTKLAKIGIVPGKEFDASSVTLAAMKGLERAPKAAQETIAATEPKVGTLVNGWLILNKTGQYGTDYLTRAVVAMIGLGANLPEDTVYPLAKVDGDGKPLSGANRYVIHFDKKDLPPVKGFWSLTMYTEQMLFFENPLHKYTVSPRNQIKHNDDGSLDLYVQHDPPGEDKEANWLPAPSDPFVLALRLYWPDASVISGQWKPPPIKRQ